MTKLGEYLFILDKGKEWLSNLNRWVSEIDDNTRILHERVTKLENKRISKPKRKKKCGGR